MIDFEQTPSFNKKAKKLASKYPSFNNGSLWFPLIFYFSL